MIGRIATLLLLIAVAVFGSGCTLLDRESYSLVLRKKAHRYRELTDAEKQRIKDVQKPVTGPGSPLLVSDDGEKRIKVMVPVSDMYHHLEPFQPFAYCYHHKSAHIPESLVAILAAPVEFPVTYVGYSTAFIVREVSKYVGGLVTSPFRTQPKPKDDPEDDMDWFRKKN